MVKKMMNINETLSYIHSVSWMGSRPGLSRITELCEKLGNPERSLKFIHVGGTNGKGSICRMLSCILEKAGYRVGLYTSPFVERFNERIMLNNTDIPDEDLASVTEYVKQSADTMEDAPTEFELITAIAFEYYRRVNCDYVVLEVGLAAEKAGIIKPGCPVLFGEGDDDAEEVIRRTAEERGSAYRRTDFSAIADVTSDLTGTSFTFRGRPVKINLHGLYQTRNTATVLTACDLLRDAGLVLPEEAVDAGLDAARWMARFEILTGSPLVIYDGAHNPQGIAGAVENVRHYLTGRSADGKVLFLMGVMADKDYDKMIGMLAPLASSVYCVTPPNSRSLPAEGVAAEYESFGVPANAFDSLTDGVNAACVAARAEGRPLVCLGSLYMYADVKHAVLRRLGPSSWEESAR